MNQTGSLDWARDAGIFASIFHAIMNQSCHNKPKLWQQGGEEMPGAEVDSTGGERVVGILEGMHEGRPEVGD